MPWARATTLRIGAEHLTYSRTLPRLVEASDDGGAYCEGAVGFHVLLRVDAGRGVDR